MVTFSHWVIFNIVLVIALIIDLYVSRKTKEVSMKEAAYRTLFWTGVAAAVGAWIFIQIGSTKLGIEYTTAYVAERALSSDAVELIAAANITASSKPIIPLGK